MTTNRSGTITSRNLNAGTSSRKGMLKGIMKPLADLLIPTKRSKQRATGVRMPTAQTGSAGVRMPNAQTGTSGVRGDAPIRQGSSFGSGKDSPEALITYARDGQSYGQRTIL